MRSSEDAERAFLLLAVASTNIHPAFSAGLSIGWSNFVIDG
jgi:hypothetical protein